MWNIPLSRMLLYAKSKIPILPIPNRSQFDCMCLINFSTAVSISSPKRKTEFREQFSQASEGRRALGFLFPLSQGPGAGRLSLDPANCYHLLGLPRCKIPAQPWGWAKGSSRSSALQPCQEGQRVPVPGSCSSCSPHIFFYHTPPIKPTDENRA